MRGHAYVHIAAPRGRRAGGRARLLLPRRCREAHASDSFRPAKHVEIEQPTSFERRSEVAGQCSGALELTIPLLVDDMNDTAAKVYNALPDRLFIVGTDARIAYRGARGPRGFKVDEMTTALQALLEEPE